MFNAADWPAQDKIPDTSEFFGFIIAVGLRANGTLSQVLPKCKIGWRSSKVSTSLRGRLPWTGRALVILPLRRKPAIVVGGRAAGILVIRILLRARRSWIGVSALMTARAYGVSSLHTFSSHDFCVYAVI